MDVKIEESWKEVLQKEFDEDSNGKKNK